MTLITPTRDLLEELDSVNESFERSTPLKILEWTFERFNDDVAMACSFEDVALLHMVHQLRPNSEIIFLDTRGHFPETLEFASRIERDWSLNMTRTTPVPTPTRGPAAPNDAANFAKSSRSGGPSRANQPGSRR